MPTVWSRLFIRRSEGMRVTAISRQEKNYPQKYSSRCKTCFKAIGIERALKILKRESKIKQFHPHDQFVYLWFIGVHPHHQGNGCGTKLLNEVLEKYDKEIYLETSTVNNIPWYKKFGFEIYNEINDFGYKFYMLKKI